MTDELKNNPGIPDNGGRKPRGGRITRRSLLKLLGGASAGLAMAAGLPGCKRKPHREIVSPAEIAAAGTSVGGAVRNFPGQVYYYASTWTEGPYPYGMMVKTIDGRPVKIEGNPDHPINRGSTTPAMQAAILSLYDPDRLKGPLMDGRPTTWAAADERIIAALKKAKSVVVITGSSITGLAEQTLLDEFTKAVPNCRRFLYETVHDRPRQRVWNELYNVPESVPHFDKARTIVSFECDFLGGDGVTLESIRRFVAGRDADREGSLSRLYAVESAVTATSALADYHIRMKPSAMADFALALREIVKATWIGEGWPREIQEGLGPARISKAAHDFSVDEKILTAMADDLFEGRGDGSALTVAGGHLPARVHAAAALLNNAVNVDFDDLGIFSPVASLPVDRPERIEADLAEGVDVLILLGVNPAYDWPGGGADFKRLMGRAGLSVGHGLCLDETLSQCDIALPSHHDLESWGDAQTWSGINSLRQPTVAPLFDTRQAEDSLLTWAKPFAARVASTVRPVATLLYSAEKGNWRDYLKFYWSGYVLNDESEQPTASTQPNMSLATSPPHLAATTQGAANQPATTQPERQPPTPGELAWQQALRLGGVYSADAQGGGSLDDEKKAVAEKLAREGSPATQPHAANPQSEIRNPNSAFELVILPHPYIYDGRFANNAWLQELPHPVNKTVWGNVASISPGSARKLGLVEGDIVRVTVKDRSVELPALIQRGQADGVVVLTLGHGRTAGGRTAIEAGGANVAPLLGRENPDHPRVAFNAKIEKVPDADVRPLLGMGGAGPASRERELAGDSNPRASARGSDPAHPGGPEYGRVTYDVKPGLAGVDARPGFLRPVRTQGYFEHGDFSQHERAIVLAGTLAEYRRDPANFVKLLREKRNFHLPEMIDTFPPYDYSTGHKWAMAIDLGRCVGCGACVAACQAENNVPVVGRDQCARGRYMHWLRIDRYEDGDEDDPAISLMPMLCQQCDNAPCETVCPVNATAHSPEGLNEMTYNRCVGTRYCQNNCPYKVRRFNFLRWQQFRLAEPVQELAFNPDVTVRGVGVMEKCTFCVQRINHAKFAAYNAGTEIKDGELKTACQQACPAGAIVFGDANDKTSAVAKLLASNRSYHVLEELNVRPNVTYLARVDNPAEG